MRAIQLTAPGTITLTDVPEPDLPDGQVLVKMQSLSICGSDMGPYRDVAPEEEYPMLPGMPSHECAGVVEEARTDGFRAGDPVIVLPPRLTGGMEYLVAPPESLVKLPPGADTSLWVICQPLGTVLWGCNRYGSMVGKRAVVIGQGPIGLLWVACLVRLGAKEVITIEPLEYRRRHGLDQGADAAIDPAAADPVEAVAELTSGAMADVVIEASGTHEAPALAVHLAKVDGTIIPFGSPHPQEVMIEWFEMLSKRLTVLTSYNASDPEPAGAVRDAVGLVERGWTDLAWLVTHRLPLDEAAEAYRLYDQRSDDALKVVMQV